MEGTAVRFGTGLSVNPWAAVPAAFADTGALLRIQLVLAAKVALLYNETYLDDNEPPFELLVPIMGSRVVGELLRELAMRGGMGRTS
ncbi:hypothetical protein LZC95_35095 [Pendulispora brunnea]|uniref:Uncharacterized protein n=1 Tax=Pendulispora brunnea TaxID=2905690 RepID=A0ABZ2JYV6_9BACT